MPRRPYPGLRPFNRDEADLFFGRDDEIDQIVDRLTSNRFLGVLGASGSGKSSLVRTGLFEALEGGTNIAGSAWQIVDTRPGGEPIARLAAALSQASARAGGGEAPDRIVEALRRGPRSIVEWCEAGNLAPDTNLLVLVDQFEELFNYTDAASRGDAQVLAGLLVESARSRQVPIYVALTMRSDYFGACGAYPELAKTISESIFLTPRMLREACEEAILGPAAVLGFGIKDDLLTLLLNDLEKFAAFDGDAGQGGGQAARQADQLPLLQYALNRIWQRASVRDADNVVLTVDDYDEIGGLSGALDKQGEATIAALGLPEQAIERVFRSLVKGPSVAMATRDPHRIREIAAIGGLGGSTAEIVAAFAADDCQFLRAQTPIEPGSYVDIPHESLIRQWRKLSAWTEREGDAGELWRRLAADASEWDEQGRDPEALLAGIQLARRREWWAGANVSQAWADRYPVERASGGIVPIGLVGDYLDAGQARHEAGLVAARRQRIRLRALVGGTAILLVLSTSAFAVYQQSVAAERLHDANIQRRDASALRLAQVGLRDAVSRAEDNEKNALFQAETARRAEAKAAEALLIAKRSADEALRQRDVAERATALAEASQLEVEKSARRAIDEAKKAEVASNRVLGAASTILVQLKNEEYEIGVSSLARYYLAASMYDNLFSEEQPEVVGNVDDLKRQYDIALGNTSLALLGSDGRIADERDDGFDYLAKLSERVRSEGATPGDIALTLYWDGRVAELRGNYSEAVTKYLEAFDVADSDPKWAETRARAATAVVRLRRLGVTGDGIDRVADRCQSETRLDNDVTWQCLAGVAALRQAQGRTEEFNQIRDSFAENGIFEVCETSTVWDTRSLMLCADVASFFGVANDALVTVSFNHHDNNRNDEQALLAYASILEAVNRKRSSFDIRADIIQRNMSTLSRLELLPFLVNLDSSDVNIAWPPERPSADPLQRQVVQDTSEHNANMIAEGIRVSVALIANLEALAMTEAPVPLSPPGMPSTPRAELLAEVRTRLDLRLKLAEEQLLKLAATGNSAVLPDNLQQARDEEIETLAGDLFYACIPNQECLDRVNAFSQLPQLKPFLED